MAKKPAEPKASVPKKKNLEKGQRTQKDITKELMKKEYVSPDMRDKCLQTGIFHVIKTHPFIGSVLQCMDITYTHLISTAGIRFNNDMKRWDLSINPHFFCNKLDVKQRKGILLHEIYHIIHQHPMRLPFARLAPGKRQMMNIAMDMAINQYIKGMPDGCPECPQDGHGGYCHNENCCGRSIAVKYYDDLNEKTKKKTPWKEEQPSEYYYEKMLTRLDDPDAKEVSMETKNGTATGTSGGGKNDKGKAMGNTGGGAHSKDLPDTIDIHDWDSSGEEGDMLDATEELMKRAIYKQDTSYDDLPDAVKDLMQHIKVRKAELNYRALILLAMRSSLPSNTRKHSWTRRSKRFGNKAPGTRTGSQPKLEVFIDTSGSISVEEATEFLEITDEFLKVGAKKCTLNMFHTSNYYCEEYKMKQGVPEDKWQSGGTCLQESLKLVAQKRPDLSIFLTDGYYSDIDVEQWVGNGKYPTTVFIISKQGNEKHPFADREWATTVKIPGESTGR